MVTKKLKTIGIITAFILTFILGAGGMFIIFERFSLNESDSAAKERIEKIIEEKVTITDNGIAEGVKKIYDAVVIVNTYNNGELVAAGTGFVYKKEEKKAYVLTNHHVIESGDMAQIVLTNGKTVDTKIIGSDVYADIAVLEIPASEAISVVAIGSSENSLIGDTVFAVGAPLDNAYSWTVTRGIVSGKDRMVEVSTTNSSTSDWIMKVIQTDAAINSGNSGGPLANVNGEVIGVTSLKLVSSGVEGMGFAIPIEDAIEYATIIERGEKVIRPYLGVSMIEASYSINYGVELPDEAKNGVFIAEVDKKSPAAKAGIEAGDFVVKIDNINVTSVGEMRYNLFKYRSGDIITLSCYRGNELFTAKVKLIDSK